MYISNIELYNIKCFDELSIALEDDSGNPLKWVMILGDNAVGKSTLLRSIALGLCDEASAAALMKEVPGEFLQKNKNKGWIKITLRDTKSSNKTFTITTEISKKSSNLPEKVKQFIEPPKYHNPWQDIFICGYGPHRASPADSSFEKYRAIDAVYYLFNYNSSLQNPELILLRQKPERRNEIVKKLLNILMLDETNNKIDFTDEGMLIPAPWGNFPIESLSDGYKSTVNWVIDFFAWQIYAKAINIKEGVIGTLLIDEIENHLHPRWQRNIVQRLSNQFKNVQFITTTHSPLMAAGISDIEDATIIKLEFNKKNKIIKEIISNEILKGMRADQVLTSDAFGLPTSRNLRTAEKLEQLRELISKKPLNKKKQNELKKLQSELEVEVPEAAETEEDRKLQLELKEMMNEVKQLLSEKQTP